MPFVRVDLPEGVDRETKKRIKDGLHDCIAKTWFKEHIWIAISDTFSDTESNIVMMSVGVRPGRGQEAERTEALFKLSQSLMYKELRTKPDEMIITMHEFDQHMCVSGGDTLPDLDAGTPKLEDLGILQDAV